MIPAMNVLPRRGSGDVAGVLGVPVHPHGHPRTLAMSSPALTATSIFARHATCPGNGRTATKSSASAPSIRKPATRSSRIRCTGNTRSLVNSLSRYLTSRTSGWHTSASGARRTPGTPSMRSHALLCTTRWLWWSRCTIDRRLIAVRVPSRHRITRDTILDRRDLRTDTGR